WSEQWRIVDWATPRNLAAWPRVSHSGSPLGCRRFAAGLGKLFIVRNYPKLPLLQTFLTIRNGNGHRFGRDGGNRQGPEGAHDGLAAAGFRLVVERLAEPHSGHEGDGAGSREEQPPADAAPRPRVASPAPRRQPDPPHA